MLTSPKLIQIAQWCPIKQWYKNYFSQKNQVRNQISCQNHCRCSAGVSVIFYASTCTCMVRQHRRLYEADQNSVGASSSWFPAALFFQKTSLLIVLNPPPPPPPPPPDGPQLPGGLLSSDPLGLNEQEDEGAWRAWVRALSSCSYGQKVGKTLNQTVLINNGRHLAMVAFYLVHQSCCLALL